MSSHVVSYVSGLYSKRGKGFFAECGIRQPPSGMNTGFVAKRDEYWVCREAGWMLGLPPSEVNAEFFSPFRPSATFPRKRGKGFFCGMRN